MSGFVFFFRMVFHIKDKPLSQLQIRDAQDDAGNLYGVADRGAYQDGIVFKLAP
jgi:hypothetical protein